MATYSGLGIHTKAKQETIRRLLDQREEAMGALMARLSLLEEKRRCQS
jgi:hypothetical protein